MDNARCFAINVLGDGLFVANHCEDALTVREAELSMERRRGASEEHILAVQGNLAATYQKLRRFEETSQMLRDVYSGHLRLHGEENIQTISNANNYAVSLNGLQRFEEAKALLRKMIPVARRVLGESNTITLRMRKVYAAALYLDTGATLDDLREAVETLEEAERIARRVLGGTHPLTSSIDEALRNARKVLRARETPSPPGSA
ncbi:unnamed protein product [Pelagomonas calceolata]|uniref:Tetratricopeptide repeat protein n=1 Tax=Pelagomonas calceolata TaxID=35677 RepID=A0A8J2WXJ6_9STRA|nr:unnamed protein product [Pelagomonas calceolata]